VIVRRHEEKSFPVLGGIEGVSVLRVAHADAPGDGLPLIMVAIRGSQGMSDFMQDDLPRFVVPELPEAVGRKHDHFVLAHADAGEAHVGPSHSLVLYHVQIELVDTACAEHDSAIKAVELQQLFR
jgi:hypothetical protein